MLDMGWERYKVAAEYDGDQHRTSRRQYTRDQQRLRELEDLGWIVIRVIAEDRPEQVVGRVRATCSGTAIATHKTTHTTRRSA